MRRGGFEFQTSIVPARLPGVYRRHGRDAGLGVGR